MTIELLFEMIFAGIFLYHLFTKNKQKTRGNTKIHKPLFHKEKPYKDKFILSYRDMSRLENDHTDEYIQACWDEMQKD